MQWRDTMSFDKFAGQQKSIEIHWGVTAELRMTACETSPSLTVNTPRATRASSEIFLTHTAHISLILSSLLLVVTMNHDERGFHKRKEQ